MSFYHIWIYTHYLYYIQHNIIAFICFSYEICGFRLCIIVFCWKISLYSSLRCSFWIWYCREKKKDALSFELSGVLGDHLSRKIESTYEIAVSAVSPALSAPYWHSYLTFGWFLLHSTAAYYGSFTSCSSFTLFSELSLCIPSLAQNCYYSYTHTSSPRIYHSILQFFTRILLTSLFCEIWRQFQPEIYFPLPKYLLWYQRNGRFL